MTQYTNLITRALFVVAVVVAGVGVWEKLANLFGYTVLGAAYAPWRLMEFAAIPLLFVIALLLWDIQRALVEGRPRSSL